MTWIKLPVLIANDYGTYTLEERLVNLELYRDIRPSGAEGERSLLVIDSTQSDLVEYPYQALSDILRPILTTTDPNNNPL